MSIVRKRRRPIFDAEFQDLITRYAWGEIWTRPGLPRHTRSLLTIGLMVALNRGEELEVASPRRAEQRRDGRRDPRGAAALRHLLRSSGGQRGVPRGEGSLEAKAKARSNSETMARFETQVGIVGAGPAGLMLSHLLHLERHPFHRAGGKSRAYCEERVRAGVLEHTSVEMLRDAGVGDRLDREGLRHGGIELGLNGVRHRIPFVELTGKCVTVYGQQEVVKDLIARRLADGGDLRFECGEVSLHDLDGSRPWIRVDKDGSV